MLLKTNEQTNVCSNLFVKIKQAFNSYSCIYCQMWIITYVLCPELLPANACRFRVLIHLLWFCFELFFLSLSSSSSFLSMPSPESLCCESSSKAPAGLTIHVAQVGTMLFPEGTWPLWGLSGPRWVLASTCPAWRGPWNPPKPTSAKQGPRPSSLPPPLLSK